MKAIDAVVLLLVLWCGLGLVEQHHSPPPRRPPPATGLLTGP